MTETFFPQKHDFCIKYNLTKINKNLDFFKYTENVLIYNRRSKPLKKEFPGFFFPWTQIKVKQATGHESTYKPLSLHKTSTTSQVVSLTQKLHASINRKESSVNYRAIDS